MRWVANGLVGAAFGVAVFEMRRLYALQAEALRAHGSLCWYAGDEFAEEGGQPRGREPGMRPRQRGGDQMHPSPEQASPLPRLQPGMPGPPDSRLDEDRGPAERAVDLLEKLVAVPSWQYESEALRLLARWLESHGLPSELHHQAGHPLALVASVGEPDPQDPAGTCLIFNSHIDTVPPAEPDRWSRPPLRLTQEGDTLFGLGDCSVLP